MRGKDGGIRLAREPGEIRLGQIVRSSEGGGAIVEYTLADLVSEPRKLDALLLRKLA